MTDLATDIDTAAAWLDKAAARLSRERRIQLETAAEMGREREYIEIPMKDLTTIIRGIEETARALRTLAKARARPSA